MASPIRIPKSYDASVIGFFTSLNKSFENTQSEVSILAGNRPINLSSESEEDISILKKLRTTNGLAISSVRTKIEGIDIEFRRRILDATGSIVASAVYDEIVFTRNEPSKSTNSTLVELHSLLKKTFLSGTSESIPLFGAESPYADIISSHQEIIRNLEESIAAIGVRFAKERISIETEFSKRKKELEDFYGQKNDALEAAEKQLQREFDGRRAELEQRQKELDDRDNTHARRALRQDLKKRLGDHSSGFKLTEGTVSLRRPVHLVSLIALAVLGGLVIYYATKAASDSLTNERLAFLVVKSLGVTIAFLGILTWYIRWMNRWFETHATAEFQLKQLELDIDRASWVVETSLEWRQSQDSTIPDHLLESISRNLFSRSEKDEGVDMNPVDHLASVLLGSASGLKLKVGDNEIDLDRRGLKEAKKG